MAALKDKRQEKFCQCLVLKGLSNIDAYHIAYPGSKKWKPTSVYAKASKLKGEDNVRLRIYELKEEAAKIAEKEFKIDATYVLKRLTEIDELDVADIFLDDKETLKPIRQWPEAWRRSISGIDIQELGSANKSKKFMVGLLKKIKWPDKTRNLELLGKHVNVQAFRDQLGLSNPSGGPIEHSDVTWREKLRQEIKEQG